MARTHTTSLEKSLVLLRAIIADGGRTPFNEIVSDLNLPTSTAYRLVSQLVDAGFASRYGPNSFGPGIVAALLYQRTDVSALVARLARPLLKDLASKSGLTSHLGVLENGMVTYKVRIPGRAPRAAGFTREGMQLEAYCSAVGKVLLGGLSSDALDDYLNEGAFVPLTPYTIVDPSVLRQEISAIRESGIAIDNREVAEDMICLAVPVLGPGGEVIAAISSSMPYNDKAPPEPMMYRTSLEGCSQTLSARLCGKTIAVDA